MLFSGVKYERISHIITNEGHIGGVDACQGDSGGPIWRVVKHPTDPDKYQAVVVGIVKFGLGDDENIVLYMKMQKYIVSIFLLFSRLWPA